MAGVTDCNLAILNDYEANKEINVAVNTPNGLTIREMYLVPLTVDTFGKECLAEGKYLYHYKDYVEVPILSMVDDALSVSECVYKSSMANAFINTKINMKKLQYGT